MDKMSAFVKEQLASGASPGELKSHMMQNGWPEKDIDVAIYSAQKKQTASRFMLGLAAIILVGILTLVLINFGKDSQQEINKIDVDEPSVPGDNGVSLQIVNPSGCSNIEESMDKDSCYKRLIETGKNCDDLNLQNDVEFTFCTRAYEDIMLKGVERIDEG